MYALIFQSSSGGGALGLGFLPIIAIFAVFYFLLIRPQQTQRKKWQEMVSGLKNGDRVVTSGGIRGTIISVKDDNVQLRVPPDNIRLEVARSAVMSVTPQEEKENPKAS